MADPKTESWRPVFRRRAMAAGLCLLAWTVAIEARLVYLQVFRHAELTARADRQQLRIVQAPAKRGDIRDRNGRVLANSVDVDSIYAVPTDFDDPQAAARTLCRALDDCDAAMLAGLIERFGRSRPFAYVQRFVSPEVAARVAALDLPGVGFMKESRRYYPNRELAAQLIGYVGVDNVGLGGLEAAYDKVVRGRPGKVLVQTDARHHAFSRVERLPTTGATIELTLDQQLQHIVERELRAGVLEHRAESGTAVVMDPHTGEILAMASSATFNPNSFRSAPESARKNRAVTDLYEPGSTFKLVTASAAIEQGVIAPTDLIDTNPGYIRFKGRQIDDTHHYGVISFSEAIVKSSNVGAIKVGLRLGAARLDEYVRRFGFGRASSLTDFPGESAGIVWNPSRLNDSAVASISMGYQVGVTPLQMAAAASAVANGGRLLQPRVVRAVVRDGVRTPIEPVEVGRAITARTAAELTSIMEEVVARGTGTTAKIEGFTVAGKTGTAQKLVAGQYSKSEYNVSFVGFVPSRKPVFTIIVVIDTPRAGRYFGGSVAGPIFQRIAEASLRHRGVAPNVFPAPPVLVTRRAQSPSRPAGGPRLINVTARIEDQAMPDLRGMSAREAVRQLANRRLAVQLQGEGLVVAQMPPPGAPLEDVSTCTLVLDRDLRKLAQAMSGTTQ